MNLNLTLLGQMITFALFVWFTLKFVWPPLLGAMQLRQKTIADGLAAAEQGHQELELAEHKAAEVITSAKAQATTILDQANQRAVRIVEEAKAKAREEGERLLAVAKADAEQEFQAVKMTLISEVSDLAVRGAEKILRRELDGSSNDALIDELIGDQ